MNKSHFFLLVIVLSFIAIACSKIDSKPTSGSAILNSVAPDFTLKDLSGRNSSLSDYKGKVILLEFWATWCPPCKASIPALIELKKKYDQRGLVIIGVSVDTGSDTSEKLREFTAVYNITYPILLADKAIQQRYSLRSIPTSFLIGKDGRIIDITQGYSEEFDRNISAQIEKLL